MLHVLVSSERVSVVAKYEDTVGTIVFVDQDITHRVTLKTTNSLVLLVDPSTELAKTIRKKYLQESSVFALDIPIDFTFGDKDETHVVSITKDILRKLEIFNMDTELNIKTLNNLKKHVGKKILKMICTGHSAFTYNVAHSFDHIEQIAKSSRKYS